MLGTSAYEAVYAGQADFTVPFFAWEGIEAERAGSRCDTSTTPTTASRTPTRARHRATSRGWPSIPSRPASSCRPLQRGYQFAADGPDGAAQILIDANPGAFTEPSWCGEPARCSAEYMRDESGKVGTQTAEQWAGYSGFLFEHGLLTGPDGAPLTTEPDLVDVVHQRVPRQALTPSLPLRPTTAPGTSRAAAAGAARRSWSACALLVVAWQVYVTVSVDPAAGAAVAAAGGPAGLGAGRDLGHTCRHCR